MNLDDAPPRLGRKLSVALQGGGSLGAFTWGVLDRLLEEERLRLDTVSGASAGAINAAILASGYQSAGANGARERLERLWRRASGTSPSAHVSHALALSTRVLSPYQFNPFDLNPLRTLLSMEIEFERLRKDPPFELLIGATRVRDGALRLFSAAELTLEALLASACLPLLHQAVSIDGEDYWDGGYAANPPLLPLIMASQTHDVLVIRIVPTRGNAHPRTVADIARRLDHMTFNASLGRDLDTIATHQQLTGPAGGENRLAACNLSIIAAENHLPDLQEADALNLDWSFLQMLRDAGRKAAEAWLAGDEGAADNYQRPSPEAQSASRPLRYVG